MRIPEGTTFDYVWYWRKRHPERKGQRCAVLIRAKMNTALVLFPDGWFTITSRWAVRRAALSEDK